ncbi:MAG: WecB/TagA/CpsF family glycosyltransferase [Planctomycetota bacterium]
MNTSSTSIPTKELLGVPIHAATMDEVVELCTQAIETRRPLHIGVVNAAKIVQMRRNALLRESVLASDLILADGMSVIWASRLLGQRLPERVAGIDLFERLLALACRRGFSVFFLGATKEVLQEVIRQVHEKYPGARTAASRDGFFPDEESPRVAEEIRRASPDMLFVAMSSPKKELFLGRWADELRVPVCHGVGGSFDVMVGRVKRAPRVWQRFGLEWLYRVVQEPRRMWRRYLVTNAAFVTMLFGEFVRKRLLRRPKPS